MTSEITKVDAARFITGDSTQRAKKAASLTKRQCAELLLLVAEQSDESEEARRCELHKEREAWHREKEELRAGLERFGVEIRTEYEEQDARRMEQMTEIEDENHRLRQENEKVHEALQAAMSARDAQVKLLVAANEAHMADMSMFEALHDLNFD